MMKGQAVRLYSWFPGGTADDLLDAKPSQPPRPIGRYVLLAAVILIVGAGPTIFFRKFSGGTRRFHDSLQP